MKDLIFYQTMADKMVRKDRGRDQMLTAMDQMWRGEWDLPSSLAELRWVHKVISTDPHDALRAGTRVLSSASPRITVQAMGPNEASRAEADKMERALGWHLKQASRRRRASVLRDVVFSALLYDEVVAQVVYLPHQIEALKAFKGDIRRLQAAKKYGPFAVLVRNPRQVHVHYSDWMPEAVVMKRVMPVQEALAFWGKNAGNLSRALNRKGMGEMKYVTVYDYMDVEHRAVWALPQEGNGMAAAPLGTEGHGGVEIMREAHGLGFLPWVARVGGTTLADEAEHQRVPLLYSVYQAGQWETQNVLETLLTSEVIAYAASPRLKVEGPGDGVEVDYGEPGRMAYVAPGHSLSQLNPPGLDSGLEAIAERVGNRIGKSTVPRVLQTGDFPSGTAYATLNLATQSGIKSLNPYKELAEESLSDILMQMLAWVKQENVPLQGFGTGRDAVGKHFTINPNTYKVEDLHVSVELTPDVPTDRMARINAASMAVRELGYSKRRALEQIGEGDPDVIREEARSEILEAVELELEKQEKLALGQFELKQRLKALEGEIDVGKNYEEENEPENSEEYGDEQKKSTLGEHVWGEEVSDI
ncbi:MAG: hypothetical protein HON98_02625 [Chloroflexi bacterium]|jgi:hypothetical protein|nr:hypothetical protein [Chloroflexota bacterium]MBT3668737.1 hypothetical protein [Chloroflexota bacterium]MBT4305438.1 hypothetical protein [Chloroflexota bacterium]MBT4533049.1 hypothetical protein [Chloroflexota bacterium]MBT4683245.1 hypothetical protein [Chloroflexota bacterium]